ncbi:MAG: hypothetical protein IKO91_04910 [Oscillospiraceae bacterium]|nr:hypothetical protein [Oscillospiraceae bacterium]
MTIALLPGDARQRYLGDLLGREGHEIVPYVPGEKADAWLFPLPTGDHPALAELPPDSLALVGKARGDHPRLRLRDYYSGEAVQLMNAAITAEGAIAAAIGHTGRTLLGSRVLILGGGRISRALAPRLRALGAAVTVYARRAEERAVAFGTGCEVLSVLPAQPEGWDLLFNTVPFPILDKAPDCPAIELASAPGGFRDPGGVIPAGGLPGKTAPHSAAEALLEPIRAILREEAS